MMCFLDKTQLIPNWYTLFRLMVIGHKHCWSVRWMAPGKNPFGMVRMMMVGAGLTPPSSGLKYRLMVAWNYITFALASLIIFNNSIGAAFIGGDDLAFTLENILFLLPTMSVISRFAVLTFRKKQLYSHLARMEALMEEIEKVDGTDAFLPVKKKADFIAIASAILLSMCCFPAYALAYYKFYFEGDDSARPFGMFVPFDTKNNVHKTVWYQAFIFYSIVYCVVMTNTLIITIALVSSGIIAKICDRYESLNLLKNQSSLQETITWHSEIIKIVEETNSLFGIVSLIEYLLSSCYISIGGFLLVKIGLANKPSFPKYIILYFGFLTNPAFICYGGHLISSENDRLVTSIFCNNWYQATARERKNLILPAMMARKRLCWKSNGFLYYDMSTYFQIVRQSYSFITMLRLLE